MRWLLDKYKKLRHKLSHQYGLQYVVLIDKSDGYYLKCIVCGQEEKFASYSDLDKLRGF